MKKILIIFVSTFLFLCLWQVVMEVVDVQRLQDGETSINIFIASPQVIFQTFAEDGDVILIQLGYTLTRALSGLILAILLAFSFTFIFFMFPAIRNSIMPINFTINAFPIIGFAPAIILIFGQGSWLSIILISMIISYFPILIALDHSFTNMSKDTIDVMKVFNATKRQILVKLYLPSVTPGFLNSLKLAIPASIIGATIGEWLGVRNGIGQLITMSMYQLKPGLLYASLVSVAMASMIFMALLYFLERRFLKWNK